MGIKVVSLFGGIECGCEALERVGIEIESYHSSEIDKYAIQTANKNHPYIIQMGDVRNWKSWDVDWGSINLLLAGFPCQSWSLAGKQGGDTDPRGKLMWVMLDILNHIRKLNPDVKFLFENVRMKGEFLHYINNAIGVKPILINSSLVSAQNRERYYWTNIGEIYYDIFGIGQCVISQPKDKKIYLNDIIEPNVDIKYFLSERLIKGFLKKTNNFSGKFKVKNLKEKGNCLTSSMAKMSRTDNYVYDDIPEGIYNLPRGNNEGGLRYEGKKAPSLTINSWEHNNVLLIKEATSKGYVEIPPGCGIDLSYPESKTRRGRKMQNKANCLMANGQELYYYDGLGIRRLTPIECERLQTLPDNYTEGISDTQRYKCCGNGWTVDVIAHILKELKIELEKEKENQT